jgi:predicted acylesterase/phospholipase RssA
MDFFNIKKQHDEHETKMLFYYLIPPFLRPIFDALIGHFFMSKPLLQLDTDHLKDVFIKNMGMLTFQEAFEKTGRIINITVAPNNSYDPPRLLNYLTAPHVCIWSSAVASCAIPGVFESVPLVVKEPSGEFHPENEWVRKRNSKGDGDLVVYSDGSVERDLPMQQISELFNVNHFIVSQVNPHSALLSTLTYNTEGYAVVVGYLRYLKALFRHWISDVIEYFAYTSREGSWGARRSSPFGISTAILTQDYEGRESDVTIMPWKGALSVLGAFMQVIRNITNSELLGMIHCGCKNTWPEIARIRTQIGVEITLDKCVQRLRRRISQQPGTSSRSTDNKTTVELFSGLSVIDITTLHADNSEDKIKEETQIEKGRSTSDFEDLEQVQSSRSFDDMEICELSTSSVKILLSGIPNTCPLPSKKTGSKIAERFNRQSDNRRKSISTVDLNGLTEFKDIEDTKDVTVHKYNLLLLILFNNPCTLFYL